MSTCLRISEAGALALHTVGILASSVDKLVSNQEIAARLKVSEHHLAKVHQHLVKAGIARAVRGPSGGFALARPASEITLLEIVEAVEGPLRPSQCLLGRPKCAKDNCVLGALSSSINKQVESFLTNTRADSLVCKSPDFNMEKN
jgi:Rrf2 family protein